MYPMCVSAGAERFARRSSGLGVEHGFGDIDEHQIAHGQPRQRSEELPRKRRESQVAGDGGQREEHARGDRRAGGRHQRRCRSASEERHHPGADREDDQSLRGQRFHEPSGAELDGPCVEYAQQQSERQEIEQ